MLLFSLFIAALILSIKTGLILGSSWLPMRKISCYAFCFGIIVIGLSYAFRTKFYLIAQWIDKYTFSFACIVGVLFIFFGLSFVSEEETGNNATIRGYWLSFLPCPFCVGALAVSVIYTAGNTKLPFSVIAVVTGFVFALEIVVISWILRAILKKFKFDLTVFFQKCLLFLGIFTLMCAFLIPNIISAANNDNNFTNISIQNKTEMWWLLIGAGLLLFIGLFKEIRNCKKRKGN